MKRGYILRDCTSCPGRQYQIPLSLFFICTWDFPVGPLSRKPSHSQPSSLILTKARVLCQAFPCPPWDYGSIHHSHACSPTPRDTNPQVSHLTSLQPHEGGLHLQICRLNHRNKSGRIPLALPAFSPLRVPEWRLFSEWRRKESL